jgi:RNA polymerase sigma-70 factor (ECF subfamily)
LFQSTSQQADHASDRELIEAAKRGDRSGFERLVHRYQERLFISVRNSVHCPILAEDIVQEAFLKAFQYLDSFKLQSEFYTWLYRIALNSRLTYFRRLKKTLSLETVEDESIPMQSQSWESPTGRMERDEQQNQVRDALARLEEHHRLILMLREFEEFDYQTIATILDVKIGTVRSRLARARARLRAELNAYEADRNLTARPETTYSTDRPMLSNDPPSTSA